MTPEEKNALNRIKENLYDFPDSLMAQHVLRKDLEILLQLVEKNAKK